MPNLIYIALSAYKSNTHIIWTSTVQIHKQQTHTRTQAHTLTHKHVRARGLKKKFSKRERFPRKL